MFQFKKCLIWIIIINYSGDKANILKKACKKKIGDNKIICEKETILLDNNNSFISSHLPKTEITLVFDGLLDSFQFFHM